MFFGLADAGVSLEKPRRGVEMSIGDMLLEVRIAMIGGV
jgi:hypothetical protein